MAAPANNILRQVTTYQKYSTAMLANLYAVIANANKKFDDFQNLEAQLGDTVSFRKPYRYTASPSLALNPQATEQRTMYLTVDKSQSVGRAFDDKQLLFYDGEEYMRVTGASAVQELASVVESDVSSVFVDKTYRFYGNGKDAIDSHYKLADALELFDEFGAAKGTKKGFLPNRGIAKIVKTGGQEFVIDRNNEEFRSWMIGNYEGCDWTKSNMLTTHIAGTVGESLYDTSPLTLTVISTTKNSNGYITAITFGGASESDANAIKKGDLFQFADGVTGHQNIRTLTFTGHKLCGAPVQFAATANAASDASGHVTVQIMPNLVPVDGDKNQNIPFDIEAGMQCWVAASHVAACINAGDSLFLAMPKLWNVDPYSSASEMSENGVSCRVYYGTILQTGAAPIKALQTDLIYGYTMDEDNSMRVCFPLR